MDAQEQKRAVEKYEMLQKTMEGPRRKLRRTGQKTSAQVKNSKTRKRIEKESRKRNRRNVKTTPQGGRTKK